MPETCDTCGGDAVGFVIDNTYGDKHYFCAEHHEHVTNTTHLADNEYDDERDQRTCKVCGARFFGGSTSTFWELLDHTEELHEKERPT